MSERRVVITGIGAISPLGNDAKSTWAGIIAGKSGIGKTTLFDASNVTSQIAGEVKGFDAEKYVAAKNLKRFDRFSIFALAAAVEAWADASIEEGDYRPTKMGCILGIGIGGLATMEENHSELINHGPRKVSPFLIPKMISNLAPGNIAINLNLQGINYTTTSACSSGTHAIGEAYRLVREGRQDVVVTGGSESSITQLGIAGFARMKALSTRNDAPERASRPFDKDRDGFVMGEGAGVLVVEEYENAKKRGANIYAEVVGYGFSCDAFHITAPRENGEGAANCMNDALQSAGINKDNIGYINAHGTATPANDPIESSAIKQVFGNYAKNGLMVSSTKSMIGHLLGAAGGIEAVLCVLAIKESIVPPTINLDEPGEGCDLDYVPNEAREVSLEVAMSNSFGFGGTNATIIIKRI